MADQDRERLTDRDVVAPDSNRDPITKAPGSHPIGVGVGVGVGGIVAVAVAVGVNVAVAVAVGVGEIVPLGVGVGVARSAACLSTEPLSHAPPLGRG